MRVDSLMTAGYKTGLARRAVADDDLECVGRP
jgi:hypothetical protein